MTVFHVGALVERLPGPKYVAALGFAEYAPPSPLPRIATLSRFREEAAEGFALSLVAPRISLASGGVGQDPGDALVAAVQWIGDAAEALAVRAIVLPTGPELTPGQRDRDRFAAHIERFPRVEGRFLAWSPTGLWEPEEAQRFAEKLGVVYAFDPLEARLAGGDVAYARIRGLGARTRISEGMLFDAQDALESLGAQEAFVAFETGRSFKDAQRLQGMLSGPTDGD